MKKIYLTVAILGFAIMASAQVAIGKSNVTGTSTLLDFESTSNYRGIILPAVSMNEISALGVNNNGTFLFDTDDAKVMMFENQTWIALSDEGDASAINVNTSSEIGEGAIIGSDTTNALGVLVLESSDKAMILPKIANPHTTVKSPYPGMICYDTVSKTFAVFDGSVWNYWK